MVGICSAYAKFTINSETRKTIETIIFIPDIIKLIIFLQIYEDVSEFYFYTWNNEKD